MKLQQMQLYLSGVWVLGSVQTHIVDVRVCKVVSGGGQADVDLPGQVHQLRVALAVVGDHVVNGCSSKPQVSQSVSQGISQSKSKSSES